MNSNQQLPVYGCAMNFGKGYQTQSNSLNASSVHLHPDLINTTTDGKYNTYPPMYSVGVKYVSNCPYYNYTLPDTYPNTSYMPINPKYYWYYPYTQYDWMHQELQIKKPSN